jgi:protoheme IX farnesyltransferase
MVTTDIETVKEVSLPATAKVRAYVALLKPRLSFLVAFSAAFGYLLASSGASLQWVSFLGVCLGGFLVSGASIIINQIIEKDLDKLMGRTQGRPLPLGKISVQEAKLYTWIVGASGLLLLGATTNALTTGLALLSMVLYGFIYTPLKRVGPVAVFIGAIPGALPPLLGWVAVTNQVTYEALAIFFLQFLWQFPHFWAIAWVLDQDYRKAGFKLLPSAQGRNMHTAFQMMLYTFFLIPMSWLPAFIGTTGLTSALVASACGLLFMWPSLRLMRLCVDNPTTLEASAEAKRIMLGSFIYLPVVQIAFLMDKL